MDIRLLGALEVRTDDDSVVDCGGVKQRSVLAQLALEPNQPVSLDRLAEGVWGEQVPPRYRQNLQVYVSTLRRAIDPARSTGTPSRIVGHGEAYELVAAAQETDVGRLTGALAQATAELSLGKPRGASAQLSAGLDSWKGEPLADLAGQPFAAVWVEHLEALRLTATERLMEARLALNEHREIVDELGLLVARHPGRERLWELLALAQVRSGRQQDALDTIRRASDVLLDEFGIDSGPALGLLEAQILRQDPAVLGVAPPAAAAEPVPVPLTPALGRQDLVDDVISALASGQRLVVLAGPGGIGKTRVALEVLNGDETAVAGAVWVPFADESPDAQVEVVIARQLAVAATGLADALSDVRLLALDNLEHIAEAGIAVSRLASRHGHLQMIVTSRGPLGIPGERVVRVGPLDKESAADLFVDRARSVLPEFSGDRAEVVELCGRLDCLPLAIELAAARLVTLGLREIVDQLPSVAHLRSDVASSARQSSVEATVAWSIGLLNDSQRSALKALATVDGTVNGAEAAVCVAARQPDAEASPLASVEALTRLGLVLPVEAASGRRFTMLQMIRAAVGTDPKDEARVGAALAAHWLGRDQAQDAIRDWSAHRLAELQDDLPLLRAVVRVLIAGGRGTVAADLVLARRRGFVQLGRQDMLGTLCATLLASGIAEPWHSRVRVVAGSAAYQTYDRQAAQLLASVADLGEEDHVYRVLGYSFRSVLNAEEGNADGARADVEEAIAAAGTDIHLLQIAHSSAGWVALLLDEPANAAAHAQTCVDLAQDDLQVMIALNELARAEIFVGHAGRAVTLMQEALQRGRRLGSTKALAEARTVLGLAMLHVGAVAEAIDVLRAALAQVAEMSDVGWTLELITAIGYGVTRLGIHPSDGSRLIRDSAATLQALQLPGEAVPQEIAPLIAQLTLQERDPALPAPTVAELVGRALTCADEPRGPATTHAPWTR